MNTRPASHPDWGYSPAGLFVRGFAFCLSLYVASTPGSAAETPTPQVALIAPTDASDERLAALRGGGYNTVALGLDPTTRDADSAAAARVRQAGLRLAYWMEVGRSPELAEAHPEWMASIQSHSEWRRFFPNSPAPATNEVVKAFPWVPVLYKESYPVHLDRVKTLLRGKPAPDFLFLNDLQGPPSACGCGHPLCRWTTDYGPRRTATRLPADAAARFVAAVKTLASPDTQVIPVWTTECEEHDRDGQCGGVECYQGACWREFTAQLVPLAGEADTIGALLLYRTFKRDLPVYGVSAGWVRQAVESFRTMPARYRQPGVAAARILPVLQGWDVTPEQLAAQKARAAEAGCSGVVVAFVPIEQDWKPRLMRIP